MIAPKTCPNSKSFARRGERNDRLFRSLLQHAPACDDIDALHDVARGLNYDFEPPLSDGEVKKTAASAWGYEISGRNFAGRGQHVFTKINEIEEFRYARYGSDACLLLLLLRARHFDTSTFALAPTAMAATDVIGGWSHHRYRNARSLLLKLGLLEVVHQGGRGKHDPKQFRLVS